RGGGDAVEEVAAVVWVGGGDDRPGGAVPVLGERVPDAGGVLLAADRPDVRVRQGGDAVEGVPGARGLAGDGLPGVAVVVLDKCSLLVFGVDEVADRPRAAARELRDGQQRVLVRPDVW